MRFDDSLRTVLASDAASGFGAQATWRQLVDLIGRGRTPPAPTTLAQLRRLRDEVPAAIRAASARALAFANPPAPLVALFAEDDLAIAAPVLRTATLGGDEWQALLPALTPRGRSVLRHRRDLPDAAVRGLESFGAVDFLLGHDGGDIVEAEAAPEPEAPQPIVAPLSETPFQPVADVARGIPVVAEALRLREAGSAPSAQPKPIAPEPIAPEPTAPEPTAPAGRFEIADLVARIDAFQRERPEPAATPAAPEPEGFRFETDETGTIRWVEGAPRAALVGISLAHSNPQGSHPQGLARVDGVAAGAFRGRARIADARLRVEGVSTAAGEWRLAAAPLFDHASGRFIGYRGDARRPRPDEVMAPRDPARAASESLRQLVHELRTPTNAIAGFAELIETQLLGPVAPPYREQAGAIRRHTMALIGAIDDLDTAARIAGHALELRPAGMVLEPMIARVLADLAPLARLRGAGIAFSPAGEHEVRADERAVERLLSRLLAALVSASAEGERLRLKVKAKGDATVAIHIDRPGALAAIGEGLDERALLAIDADRDAPEGAPLLGTGFALRLARNLAAELGGGLVIGADRLTLRLPAALDREVGRAAE